MRTGTGRMVGIEIVRPRPGLPFFESTHNERRLRHDLLLEVKYTIDEG